MLILTRVNDYYSPYTPHTIMEEEKIKCGDVFGLAEEEFLRHRLLTLYPKIDEEGTRTAIGFLATQKLVNCSFTVHTEERGYEWIVFRRQPDGKIGSDGKDEDDVILVDGVSDDDDFFSAEAEETILAPVLHEGTQDNKENTTEMLQNF